MNDSKVIGEFLWSFTLVIIVTLIVGGALGGCYMTNKFRIDALNVAQKFEEFQQSGFNTTTNYILPPSAPARHAPFIQPPK